MRGLGKDDRVHVLACATRCDTIVRGEVATTELAIRAEGAPRARRADGHVAAPGSPSTRRTKAIGGDGADKGRIIYLGDGIASTGELDAQRLAGEVRRAIGGTRVTTVALGGETDDVFMGALSREDHAELVPRRVGDRLGARDRA